MKHWSPSYSNSVKISVVGIGGAGCNALAEMADDLADLELDWLAINTDAQSLQHVTTPTLQLGQGRFKGLGAGANPELARIAAVEDREHIAAALGEPDIVFVIAGMGGGTGTGAAPVVAEVARAAGALCIAFVTLPFAMEGAKRQAVARQGHTELLKQADAVFAESNERLFEQLGGEATLQNAFTRVNGRIEAVIRALALLHRSPGMVSIDVADLHTLFERSGGLTVGTGKARGADRALSAVRAAVADGHFDSSLASSPRALIILRSDLDVLPGEFAQISDYLRPYLPEEQTVILGTTMDSALTDELAVTIIATGQDAQGVQYPQFDSRSLSYERASASVRGPSAVYGAKPIHLLVSDKFDAQQVAAVLAHLSALYRSVGGDELLVTRIDHVTPQGGTAVAEDRSKRLRRTG